MNKFFPHIILLILATFGGVGRVYAQDTPPPGEQIINQVSGTYIENGGLAVDIFSNEVKVVVEGVTEFNFWPNNSITEFRGRSVQFSHFLRNTGNATTTIDIKGYNTTGDDFDMQDLTWTSSGLTKSNAAIANTDTIKTSVVLEPNQEFEVTYIGWISDLEERKRLSSIMVFEATARETGFTAINADTISIQLGAIVDIEKQQIGVTEDLKQGDSFTYSIQGENTGDLTALPRQITVDGNPAEKVILTDSIPVNLTFVAFNQLDKGTPYYHVNDGGVLEFSTTPPEDLSLVDIIGVGFDSLNIGETFDASFDVRVNDNATGKIDNIAEVSYVDPEGAVTTAAASNLVTTTLPDVAAAIDYFTSEDFEEETGTSTIGEPLHIQASASACNEQRNRIEEVLIEITSTLTGDMETFTGVETGPNTGVFRIQEQVPTRNGFEFPVVVDNKILETAEDDIIVAQLECNGLIGGGGTSTSVEAEVLVDPFGIVFDSETNQVIAGAEVRIFDVTGANNGGNPGGLAIVYTANGREETNNISTSGSAGKYKFPFLRPGTYRLEVIPPRGYTFSSVVPVDSLPEERVVDSQASYGLDFDITGQATGLDFDIPLDPQALGVLLAEKTVDRSVAEIGDFVNYTITLKSQAVNTVENLTVFDRLPFGFEYQPGSAKLDGVAIEDSASGIGPDLEFEIGDIDPGQTLVLTYRVYLGPGSERSDGINVAFIQSDELVVKTSNEAKVKIEVRGGVFNDEALIIGKVFLDCDENNMQNGAELGIPGVRLYLENGNYVITDSNGMYSFYAIKPNKHVLKLDNYSLPAGTKMKVLDNRHAFDPSSRFVDVKKGEMHRADFAVCECNPGIINEIKERADLINGVVKDNLSSSLKQSFSLNDRIGGSGNSSIASGTVGNVKAPVIAPSSPGKVIEEAATTEIVEDSIQSLSIEEMILDTDAELAFLNIADGDTIRSEKVTIWAKGKQGALFDLFVNGEVIGAHRIGQRSVLASKGIQVWEYVSIDLEPGRNEIELVEGDPFGNVRASEKVTIITPGELNQVVVTVPRNNVAADGTSTALVSVKLVDKDGILIGSRMPVTLDVSMGVWKVADMDAQQPGTQVFIEGGQATFELQSTIEPVTSKVRASVGVVQGEAKVEFLPDLRPLIAAGIIEGTIRLREPLNINSDVDNDGFERELKQLSYDMNAFTADGRFAFFLKGKVSGKTLLTAGFDSEKEKEERLFRDIRPEEFYPVYGESSIKGFDAQSSGRLYLRLDRGKTYALYGDFITQENHQDIQLSGYSRSQNGLKTYIEQGRASLEAFGVSSVSARRIRELRAQGISRYELPDRDLIDNSEIIELITYDREQTEVILSIERLARFSDYVIDPFSGVITFKNPVFGLDSDFNPVFIRATYEVENDSERYLIGGVRGEVEVVDGLTVGAGVVQDNNPTGEFTIASTNLNFELGESTKIIAEAAHTIDEVEGTGNAGRVEVRHKGKGYELNGQVGRSDENFSNPGASLGQSRTEAQARGRLNLTSKTNLNAEFRLSRNDTTGDQTLGTLVGLKHSFQSGINAELGVRYSEQTNSTSEDITNTNLRSKVTTKLPFVKGATAFGEYEQDLNAADRKTVAVGGDYKIQNIARAYAKHEFISSAGGRYTLQSNAQRNNTVFGIDANYMKNGKVFSEYRMNDALDGRTGQASLGLRNSFSLREGLALNAGFERIFTVQGPSTNDGTAISSSIEYTGNENWKGSARVEARFGANANTYLNSLGYGLKINTDWTFLARNIMAVNTSDGISGIRKLQERLQIGAAYRSTTTNRFDALFRYEFKYEKDQNVAPDFFRTAHVVSSHANYHPTSDLVLSGRVAAKYSLESDDQLRSESFLELVSGRAIYDINDRWDAGINASILANSDFTTKDYGLGVEVGYLVATNLRLATGFNFFGYEDEDLAANNYTQAGTYLGFSYKFDEQVFKSLAPQRSKNFIDENMYLTCVPCEKPMDIKTMPVDMPEYSLEPVTLAAGDFEYEPLTTYVLLPRQIHFDNDKSYINPSTAQMLDKVAKFLMNEDDYTINLSGFTDTKSSVEYNQALSDRRSMAARAYLVAAGVEDRKLIIDGYGELQSKGENIVEMALERKVQLDLNELNSKVTFVDQVEDLQIQQKAARIGAWDYIFKSEHNAVPTNMNLASGTTSLSYLNKYILQRIAMTMKQYPSVVVTIGLPNDARFNTLQSVILDELSNHGADIMRFMFTRGASGDATTVRFDYRNAENLTFIDQRDDVKFANNKEVPALLESLLEVLNSREDYALINDLSQSYVVPDRVNFTPGKAQLDNETQAVLSRIGSYLRNNPSVYLELIGDGSAIEARRMKAMLDYLVDWGIQPNRITTSRSTINTEGKSIRIEYRNADSINLRNIEFLNRERGQN
ncbi:MAG: OmpA family protein [Balneola sp.]